MTLEYVQSRVAAFLQEADSAACKGDWSLVRRRALDALALQKRNAVARALLRAAEARLEQRRMQGRSRRRYWDAQTARPFDVVTESPLATLVAGISAIYLLTALGFFAWLGLDTLVGRYSLLQASGYDTAAVGGGVRLLLFVAVAGALGGTLDGIRSHITWHSERRCYGARFIWRDVARPWVGSVLGVLGYVALRSGSGVVNGDFTLQDDAGFSVLAGAIIGFLGGFSSAQVFRWLDDKGNRLFATQTPRSKARPRGRRPAVRVESPAASARLAAGERRALPSGGEAAAV